MGVINSLSYFAANIEILVFLKDTKSPNMQHASQNMFSFIQIHCCTLNGGIFYRDFWKVQFCRSVAALYKHPYTNMGNALGEIMFIYVGISFIT